MNKLFIKYTMFVMNEMNINECEYLLDTININRQRKKQRNDKVCQVFLFCVIIISIIVMFVLWKLYPNNVAFEPAFLTLVFILLLFLTIVICRQKKIIISSKKLIILIFL